MQLGGTGRTKYEWGERNRQVQMGQFIGNIFREIYF